MAANDSRSRNKRSSRTTTTTNRQKYQTQERSNLNGYVHSAGYWQDAPDGADLSLSKPTGKYDQHSSGEIIAYSYDGKWKDNEGNRLYRGGDGPSGTDNFTKVVNDTKTKVTHNSSTSYNPKDQRNVDSAKDSKQKKLKTKKEGRSKLRIQASGDSSAARLKGGPNSGREKNKLKIDVQTSGGKTGLNVPR